MKYDKMTTARIVTQYGTGASAAQIAAALTLELGESVPERSIIAKLSSLGIYRKKTYLTKRGETPVKKEEYITRIAKLLDVNAEILESLEKVNKNVLQLIASALTDPKLPQLPTVAQDKSQNVFVS